MSESRRCPQCGAEIPANSPSGLCPQCLLRAANDSRSAAASEPGPTRLTPPNSGFVPPSVEDLAERLPQLEILELLGKGGMGAVYKARQRQLDRFVAVKILPSEISHDPAFAERFAREARALAKLNHPHIVGVYDFGQTVGQAFQPDAPAPAQTSQAGKPDLRAGLCYFVMEFVEGTNLRQVIQRGELKPDEALAIIPQICEALQYAHEQGVVHRDIKPENILIDTRGRVKIADFGLAKLLDQDAADHALTATHQVMGTLKYMAPEQLEGSRDVDHRADIYSLGVIFYELLTRELPLGRFAPPSKKVAIDVRLDEVVLRALEKEPEQRYQHASELKSEIDTISRTPLPASVARPESSKGVELSRVGTATPFDDSGRATQSRFSRFAIAGAVWAMFGLLTVIPLLYFIGLNRVWNGTALPTDVIHSEPPWWFSVFMGVLLAIGAGAPIGTTIFGAIALGHIKRSDGKIYGLPLAFADAFFFPLLLLFAAVSFAFGLALAVLFFGSPIQGVTAGTLAAMPVCFFVGRAAWRANAPKRGDLVATDAKSESGTSPPTSHDQTRSLIDRTAEGLWFLAAVALFSGTVFLGFNIRNMGGLHEGFRDFREFGAIHLFYGLVLTIAGLLLRWRRARLILLFLLVIFTLCAPSAMTLILREPEWAMSWETVKRGGMGCLWAGIPLGLWTIWLLLRDDVRAAFEAESRSAKNAGVSLGPEQISLWSAISGVVLPAVLLIGGIVLSSRISVPDGFVTACFILGVGLELVAVGCGIVARETKSGKAGLIVGSIALLLWMAMLATIPTQDVTHEGQPETIIERGAVTRAENPAIANGAPALEELLTLKGHTGYVYNVRFSPDGKRIASASHDGTAKVWNAETGAELFTCRGHTSYVHGLAYNHDGSRLGTTSEDGSIRIWDANTGEQLLSCTGGHPRGASNLAFSPNGERVASACVEDKVKVWNAQTGDAVFTLESDWPSFYGVAYSPDGKWIAGGAMNGTVWLWDANTGREADVHREAKIQITSIAFDRGSQRLAALDARGDIRVWGVPSGELITFIQPGGDAHLSITLSPDGQWIAAGGMDGTVKFWDVSSGREILSIKAHPRLIKSVAFNHDGTRLATGSDDKTVKVWKVTPSPALRAEEQGK